MNRKLKVIFIGEYPDMTKDKSYEIVELPSADNYVIIDDNGRKTALGSSLFKLTYPLIPNKILLTELGKSLPNIPHEGLPYTENLIKIDNYGLFYTDDFYPEEQALRMIKLMELIK